MNDRPPGQWPADVQVMPGFRYRAASAVFAVWPERIELYAARPRRSVPHAVLGILLVLLGLIFAGGVVSSLSATAWGWLMAPLGIFMAGIGGGMAQRGITGKFSWVGTARMPAPTPDLLEDEPAHTWPRRVEVEWGRIVRFPDGVEVKADLPHRRGLRAMLEA